MASYNNMVLPLNSNDITSNTNIMDNPVISYYIKNFYYNYINGKKRFVYKSKPVDPELGLTHSQINGYFVVNIKET